MFELLHNRWDIHVTWAQRLAMLQDVVAVSADHEPAHKLPMNYVSLLAFFPFAIASCRPSPNAGQGTTDGLLS
eukprot:4326226-Amphidinium_carterae.1